MPLKTLVKAGNITNLSDARYFAGMGVDLLGFSVVDGAPHYMEPTLYQEIRGWVTGPFMVAEIYGLRRKQDLERILEDYKPDYIELSLAELKLFDTLPLNFILRIDGDVPIPPSLQPSYLLQRYDAAVHSPYPTLLSIETKEDLTRALNDPIMKGIALNGSAEIRPGLKDFDALAAILEELDAD
jgi:phosphoribosylanthranilate isomerase